MKDEIKEERHLNYTAIYIYIYIYNGTQWSIKANDYQLAKIDICEHKSKVQAKKYDKF